MLLCLKRQDAHQVKGVCMVGLDGKSPQALSMSFGVLAREHVPESRLVELPGGVP
jgi:hypothetical protein